MSNLGSSLVSLMDAYGDPVPTIDGYLGVFVNAGQIDSYTFDSNGNPIDSYNGALNVNIASGTIVATTNPDSYTFDGYGNQIGSQGGSLDVFVTNTVPITGSVSVDNFPDVQKVDGYIDLYDGYNNPIGSVAGALNVNVTTPITGTFDAYTFDGYGNQIGSQGGSLDVFVTNTVPITGTVSVDNFPSVQTVDGYVDVRLRDGYNNPLGSVSGALNVNVVSEPLESLDSYTFDGYGNPIGSVVGSLNVNLTNSFIPSSPETGDFYKDNSIQAVATSPAFTSFAFGFISTGIIVANDDTASGSRSLEFSFDSFTTVHGILQKGQEVTMDNRRRSGIQLRAAGTNPTTRAYRLIVWA